MNTLEQLEKWLDGEPVHNDEQDRCVPDLSCCRGVKYLANSEDRQKFFDAYEAKDFETTSKMHMGFIVKILDKQFPGHGIALNGFKYE